MRDYDGFCGQRKQVDAADQRMPEQFDEQSLYDRARVAGDLRL